MEKTETNRKGTAMVKMNEVVESKDMGRTFLNVSGTVRNFMGDDIEWLAERFNGRWTILNKFHLDDDDADRVQSKLRSINRKRGSRFD